jgi:hypothetical protein
LLAEGQVLIFVEELRKAGFEVKEAFAVEL